MKMDTLEVPEKPSKIEVKRKQERPSNLPGINMDAFKIKNTSSPLSGVSGSPRLERALTKPSSARWNCLCSPTTHVGSFRCRLHRGHGGMLRGGSVGSNLSDLAAKSGYN